MPLWHVHCIFPDLLQDTTQIKSCLAKACEGGHSELVTFWLDHLTTVNPQQRITCADFTIDNDPVAAACKGREREGRGSTEPDLIIFDMLVDSLV